MGGRRVPAELCTRCKGYKKLCGLPTCPILERFRYTVQAVSRLKDYTPEVYGSTPPSIVVGEEGYPKVNLLYHIPPEVHGDQAREYDDPVNWFQRRLPLARIIGYRAYLLASRIRVDVREPWKLYEKEISLAATSEKPVDSNAILKNKPKPILNFDGLLLPYGPTARAARIRVEGNPRLPPRLEKLIWDDVKASEAITELYRSGVSIYTIMSALSLGLLGRLRERRLVPTRWAITAVDATIGDALLHTIRTRDVIDQVEVYHGAYLGNRFAVILIPGSYEAEMLEIWHPLTPWTQTASKTVTYTVREHPSLRLELMDGGYLAARLAVAEHLYKRKRQAKVVIVREITKDYYAPVGNWHIRETVRHILSKTPQTFDSLDEALAYVEKLILAREAATQLRGLKLVKKLRSQRSLDEYFTR